jgi:hypothetical protein
MIYKDISKRANIGEPKSILIWLDGLERVGSGLGTATGDAFSSLQSLAESTTEASDWDSNFNCTVILKRPLAEDENEFIMYAFHNPRPCKPASRKPIYPS